MFFRFRSEPSRVVQKYRSNGLRVTVSNLQLVCGTVWRHWIWEGWVVVCKAFSVDTGLWVGGKKVNLATTMSKIIILILCCPVHVPAMSSVLEAHSCSCNVVSLYLSSVNLLITSLFGQAGFLCCATSSPSLSRLIDSPPLLLVRYVLLGCKFHPKMRQRLNSWQIWHSIVSLKSDTIHLVYLWYSTELSLLCLWLPIKANMWHSRKCFF